MLSAREKAKLSVGKDNWTTQEMEGVPSIRVSDGPGGLRIEAKTGLGFNESHPAVCHPTASLLACSFDRELLYELGEMLAEECQAQGVSVLLGPGVNHKRSPLCGRNFEYYSEDPVLSGELGAAYVKGLQDHGVGTSVKHFAGNSREKGRLICDSVIDERALREIYLKQFEIIVRKAHPWTIMAAYNMLNGTYCTENAKLLRETARKEWGFDGVFVSDWGAVSDPVRSVKNGLNLEMPGGDHGTSDAILNAMEDGIITPEELDESAGYMLKLIEKGAQLKRRRFDLKQHLDFSQKAAEQSAVLLKNEGVLPLKADQKIALIGAFAKHPRFQGAGSSQINAVGADCLYDVFEEEKIPFTYTQGYETNTDRVRPSLIREAAHLASHADAAVLVIGLPERHEAEGYDRHDLDLPENQNALVEAVCAVQKNVIVVLQCGAPVILPWRDNVQGILCMYLSGGRGGHALYRLLYGKANPSGHLAETWPLRLEDTPSCRYFDDDILQAQYRESIFTGYRYYDTLRIGCAYPFGYGLSYTHFSCERMIVALNGENAEIKVQVRNDGNCSGRAVLQLYTGMRDSRICRPDKELKDFSSVLLNAGEKKEVIFTLPLQSLAFFDTKRNAWIVEEGTYRFMIGDSVENILLEEELSVAGETDVHADLKKEYLQTGPEGLYVSDRDFETVLGREIPSVAKILPVGRNTAIADLEDTRIGRYVHRAVKHLLKNNSLKDVSESMIWEAPVRMLLMGSRRFTWETVDGAAELLNGHLIRGIRRIRKSLK